MCDMIFVCENNLATNYSFLQVMILIISFVRQVETYSTTQNAGVYSWRPAAL